MIVREVTKRLVRACPEIERLESGERIEIIEDELEKRVGDEKQFIGVAADDNRLFA